MNIQKKIKVLVVEDDALVAEVIQERLEQIGYVVVGKAADGQLAVEMAASLQPDIVLMDIEMPNMDGIEATRRIYESCPTPVVMLTAYETPELIEKASAAGAGAYLIKLPKPQEIERAVTIAMARFADMMQLRYLNQKLQTALDEVKTLSGLLPICANCKKIRDDEGYWQDVAVYIRNHTDVEFSHGICPDCVKGLYPDFPRDDW